MWVETRVGTARLDHVLASHSLNEEAMRAHIQLYRTIMFGPSPLDVAERQAIAVAVSAANDCHY